MWLYGYILQEQCTESVNNEQKVTGGEGGQRDFNDQGTSLRLIISLFLKS